MDINSVIRELRVDWEDLLTTDFDPLPYLKRLEKEDSEDANNFRNIFYKVEKVMEQIIEKDYQLFNDSMLLFSNFYEKNQNNLSELEKEIYFCDDILKINTKKDLKIEELKEVLWFDEYNKKIQNFNDLLINIENSIYNKNNVHAANLLKDAFCIFNEYHFNKLKNINFKQLKNKRNEIFTLLYEEIESFLKGNISEFKEQCDSLINLGGLNFLDKNLIKNLNKILVREINEIIDSFKDRTELTIKLIIEFLDLFFQRISALISYCLNFDDEKTNFTFFEMEIESGKKIIKNGFTSLLNKLLFDNCKKIIQLFCFTATDHDFELVFEINDIVDRVNYNEYFPEEKYIHYNEKSERYNLFSNSSTENLFIFYDNIDILKNEEIKKYVVKEVKSKYFRNKNHKLQRKIIFILSDKREFQVDYCTGYSKFYEKINFNDIFYRKELNDKKFLEFIFELIKRKVTIYFYDIFKGRVSLSSGSVTDKIIKHEFENIEFLSKNQIKNIIGVINTLNELEKIKQDNKIEEITQFNMSTTLSTDVETDSTKTRSNDLIEGKQSFSDLIKLITLTYKNEYVLEFMFYFNTFYKNRSKFQEFITNLKHLFVKYENVYQVSEFLFSNLNFYIKNMLKILDVNSVEELKDFNSQLILLDDVLAELKTKANDSLYFSIDYFTSLIENKPSGIEEERFLKRLIQ